MTRPTWTDVELIGGVFDGTVVAWSSQWDDVERFIVRGGPVEHCGGILCRFVGTPARLHPELYHAMTSFAYQRTTASGRVLAHDCPEVR